MFGKKSVLVGLAGFAVAGAWAAAEGGLPQPAAAASAPVAGAALAALSSSAPTIADLARAQQAAVEANFKEQMSRVRGAAAPLAASAASSTAQPAPVFRAPKPKIVVDHAKLVLSIYGPQGGETAELQLPSGEVLICRRSCRGSDFKVESVNKDGVVVASKSGTLTVPVGARFR